MANYFAVFVDLGAVDGGLYGGGVAKEIQRVGTTQLVGVGSCLSNAALAKAQGDVLLATTWRRRSAAAI